MSEKPETLPGTDKKPARPARKNIAGTVLASALAMASPLKDASADTGNTNLVSGNSRAGTYEQQAGVPMAERIRALQEQQRNLFTGLADKIDTEVARLEYAVPGGEDITPETFKRLQELVQQALDETLPSGRAGVEEILAAQERLETLKALEYAFVVAETKHQHLVNNSQNLLERLSGGFTGYDTPERLADYLEKLREKRKQAYGALQDLGKMMQKAGLPVSFSPDAFFVGLDRDIETLEALLKSR